MHFQKTIEREVVCMERKTVVLSVLIFVMLILAVSLILVLKKSPETKDIGKPAKFNVGYQVNPTSTGNPQSLSYTVPAPDNTTRMIESSKVIGAKCTSTGLVVCLEPVVDVIFASWPQRNINRTEQIVFLKLKNNENAPVYIANANVTSKSYCSNTGLIGKKIDAGKEVITGFLCTYPTVPENLTATVLLNYNIAPNQRGSAEFTVSTVW
jgi:hypothetical protein